MRIQTSHTETMTTRDGVAERHEESVVTVVTSSGSSMSPCADLERIDDFDDLYQCGLAHAQRMGQMEAFTERFNAERCCDAQEKAMIDALKDFLRPQQAPADLLGRVMQCLDRICDEEESGSVGVSSLTGSASAPAHVVAGFASADSTVTDESDRASRASAEQGGVTHTVGFVSAHERPVPGFTGSED